MHVSFPFFFCSVFLYLFLFFVCSLVYSFLLPCASLSFYLFRVLSSILILCGLHFVPSIASFLCLGPFFFVQHLPFCSQQCPKDFSPPADDNSPLATLRRQKEFQNPSNTFNSRPAIITAYVLLQMCAHFYFSIKPPPSPTCKHCMAMLFAT